MDNTQFSQLQAALNRLTLAVLSLRYETAATDPHRPATQRASFHEKAQELTNKAGGDAAAPPLF